MAAHETLMSSSDPIPVDPNLLHQLRPNNIPTMAHGGTSRLRGEVESFPDAFPTHEAALRFCYGESYERRAETDFLADYFAARQQRQCEVWVDAVDHQGLYAIPDDSYDSGYCADDPLFGRVLMYGDWLCLGSDFEAQDTIAPPGVFDGYFIVTKVKPIFNEQDVANFSVAIVPNPRKFVLKPVELDRIEDFIGVHLDVLSSSAYSSWAK